MTAYNRLSFYDRQKIEEGLDVGKSFRQIGEILGRSTSTISREVKENRSPKASPQTKKVKCRELNCCTVTGLCEQCPYPHRVCVECKRIDCRGVCKTYAVQTSCLKLASAPWVCNSCNKRRYGCRRQGRMDYTALRADAKSVEVRRESRQGFDMTLNEMEKAAAMVKEGLSRGLSPYETSVAYAGVLKVSESTLYRLVEAGIGGLANIELERKVGFKPRRHTSQKKSTSHSKERSYEAFCALPKARQATTTEMDCVEGRRCDTQTGFTLYHRPSHLQLLFLLSEQEQDQVKKVLAHIKSICPEALFEELFATVLTDNGGEFGDEDGMDTLFGGSVGDPHLFYCDPRRSDQKCRCEKNHSEIRQLLPKDAKTPFDELDMWDMAVVASHINSNPRKILCGLSPIQMFKTMFGEEGTGFLMAAGIEEIPLDKLTLKPYIVDIERRKRGLPPINWK